jgi:rhamnose transport system substrate-binding protein
MPRRTALAVAASLAVAACGGGSHGPAPGTTAPPRGLRIAFLPKQLDNPYFTVADQGAADAVARLHGHFQRVGPSTSDASSQVAFINRLIAGKPSAIVISANDPNAVVPALERAMAMGIKVVTYDSDSAPAGRELFVNQADADELGRSQVRLLAKQLGAAGGEFAILSATPDSPNQTAWIRFMKAELTKPQYARLRLVKTVYGNDDDDTSYRLTGTLLRTYPDLRGIISPTTVGIAAAARYLEGSGLKGRVKLTGLGTPNQLRRYVKDGTIDAFELWDPGKLGYLAAYAAAALASGEITGKPGESFAAGTLGRRTVGAGGQVVLGPPTVFDAANIDRYDF